MKANAAAPGLFRALIALPRPLNCLITAFSVGVGAFAAGFHRPDLQTGCAALAAALIAGAGNALNDVADLEIDRINRPHRPLPAGRLSRRVALIETLWLALSGLALAWWLGPLPGALALAILLLLVLYDLRLKRSPLWGNLLVSLLAASAFPFGALAHASLGRAWIPATFAFLFHLGREIAKDLEDLEGDRALGARTLPLIWGERPAARLAALIYWLLVPLTLLPWGLDLYGWQYLALVLGVDLIAAHTALLLWRQGTASPDAKLSRRLKLGMLLGLLAVVAGELG